MKTILNTPSQSTCAITKPFISGQGLGFYDDEGNFADNTLSDYATREMTECATQFSPSDYDWGEGYYTMQVSDGQHGLIMVRVEWWIEE
jgi:hypothetical protein